MRAVDATRINRSFDNIESFTATLKDNRQNVDQILKDAATLTAGLNTTRAKADTLSTTSPSSCAPSTPAW